MEMQRRIIGFKKITHGKKEGGLVIFSDHGLLEDDEPLNTEDSKKFDRKISSRFDTQLRTLLGHALLFLSMDGKKIGEKEIKNRRVVEMPDFKNVAVTGYKVSMKGEDEVLTIDIVVSARGGKVKITTPPILLNDPDYEHYEFLSEDLASILEETNWFLEGKNFFDDKNLFNQPAVEEKKPSKPNKKEATADNL